MPSLKAKPKSKSIPPPQKKSFKGPVMPLETMLGNFKKTSKKVGLLTKGKSRD